MRQYNDLTGTRMSSVGLPDMLADILMGLPGPGSYDPPYGITGVDLNTGLVKVQLSAEKTGEMKFGKYLRKVGFNEDVIRDTSSLLSSAVEQLKGAELSYTTTSGEAVEVYAEGPHSCMAHSESVGVYATDDVAVAYVKIGERIVARSVVCKNEEIGKHFVCIYGNKDLMYPLLLSAGFAKQAGNLEDCKLLRITNSSGNVLLPYLDGHGSVDDKGDHLLVASNGDYCGQNTSGLMLGCICDRCEEAVNEDEAYYSDYYSEQMCESCHNELHVYIESRGEDYALEDDDIISINGDYYHRDDCQLNERTDEYMLEDECEWVEYSNEYLPEDDVVMAFVGSDYAEESCAKADCELIEGKWIHDDFVEEHKQLSLDLEDEDEE